MIRLILSFTNKHEQGYGVDSNFMQLACASYKMRVFSKIHSAVLEILQKQEEPFDSVGESFAKLQIEDAPTVPLEKELEGLSLEDKDKPKLISRAPDRPRATPIHIHQPYPTREGVHINQYVLYGHGNGGILVYANNYEQQAYNVNINRNDHLEPRVDANRHCVYCTNSQYCEECKIILEIASTPDFFEFNLELLQNIDDNALHEPNISRNANMTTPDQGTSINLAPPKSHEITKLPSANIAPPSHTDEVVKSVPVDVPLPPRRGSKDSGFQSDIASPQSDSVLSPASNHVPDIQKCPLRRILPTTAQEQSARESLRSILIPDIKVTKWVEVVMKPDDEVFATDDDGQTILHRLLKSKDKYIAESFYATMERLKQDPSKCEHIVAAESSISEAIQEYDHPSLFLDYFGEVLQFIHEQRGHT